jgi:glycosyltransferase involved in cell wall biosynthesis
VTISKPLVSLGVPVYNGERFIGRVLDSLVGQTYQNLEIVISDNASTDRTAEICQEYANRDRRIRYSCNAKNLGLPANWRRVFEISLGDYFAWTGADDVRPPTFVEDCVVALVRQQGAVMAYGPVIAKARAGEDLVEVLGDARISATQVAERVRTFTHGLRHNALLYGLYRRDALAKTTYVPRGYGKDYLLCLQMCVLGTLAYVSTPMIIYRERTQFPRTSPMPENVSITATSLLRAGRGKKKCWRVLLMGGYYLFTIRDTSLSQRLAGIAAHASAFSRRHYTRLAKDAVFLLVWPLNALSRRFTQRWPRSLRFARRLRALVTRA